MITAVIDIGTNTVLLLVARIRPDGSLESLVDEQRIPRLGRRVDASRRIQPESTERMLGVLREYRSIMASYPVDSTVVSGTSVLRDASNREEIAGRILAETGFSLEILPGEDEARWTFRGALSGIDSAGSATVVDVGGGSTEITWGERDRLVGHLSVDVGAVRLTERYFAHDPPLPGEVERACRWVREALEEALGGADTTPPLVGVAGTATSLALLDRGASEFSRVHVAGYRLSRARVQRLAGKLMELPASGILSLAEALKGREDIITAGTLILRELMEILNASELVVSERGVRYGLALREWERAGRG